MNVINKTLKKLQMKKKYFFSQKFVPIIQFIFCSKTAITHDGTKTQNHRTKLIATTRLNQPWGRFGEEEKKEKNCKQ